MTWVMKWESDRSSNLCTRRLESTAGSNGLGADVTVAREPAETDGAADQEPTSSAGGHSVPSTGIAVNLQQSSGPPNQDQCP